MFKYSIIYNNIKIRILTAIIFIPTCFGFANERAQKQDSKLIEVKNAGVFFYYNTDNFAKVEVKIKPKTTAQDIDDGVPVGIAPEHFCFNLKDKRPLLALEEGARYFYPNYSFICVIPLKDSSVKDFDSAYPGLNSAALNLQKTLRERPGKLKNLKAVPGDKRVTSRNIYSPIYELKGWEWLYFWGLTEPAAELSLLTFLLFRQIMYHFYTGKRFGQTPAVTENK